MCNFRTPNCTGATSTETSTEKRTELRKELQQFQAKICQEERLVISEQELQQLPEKYIFPRAQVL
jgi:hypothetical protein